MSTRDPAEQRLDSPEATPAWLAAFKAWAPSPDVVLVVDAAGMLLRLNRPIGSITPMDLKTEPIWAWTSEGLTTKLRAVVHHALHPGIPQVIEADFPSGAGRRWYRIQSMPCGPAEDRVALLHCTDIDAQRRELERLQEGERLMHDGEGMAHLGTWYWDISQPHATWSHELYNIYGLDAATHVPTYDDYLTRIHPDDVERVKHATERAFKDFESYSHDERIRHADGTWRHLHTWARPVLHDDGTLHALQGVCLDITRRKESEIALAASEHRQRLILDYAGLGIASISPDGVIEQANVTLDRLTGIEPVFAERFVESAEVVAAIDDLLNGHSESRTVGATPAGALSQHVRLLLTRVDEGLRPFVVVVAQDVTPEALALEAEAKIRDLEARQASQARVVGMAGHELKNPLTPILMQLALLEHGNLGPLDDAQSAALAKIRGQTVRIQSLLQDLLDTARSDGGALTMAKAEVDVADLVRNAADMHQATAASFGVVLVTHTPDELSASVDAGRMVQVVDNLVLNAIRFTPTGRRVDVDVRDDGESWTLQVSDEGVGIPEDQQDDIFEAYVMGDTPAPHDLKSSGLGLFVVRGIVEAHGGTLTLTSSPGAGTCLTAIMPK